MSTPIQTTVDAALTWAQREANRTPNNSQNWGGLCDHAVAVAYAVGHSITTASAEPTAVGHWSDIPRNRKHPDDRLPAKGALLFWSGGSQGAGHVAIYMGKRKIATNDIFGYGGYYIARVLSIHARWGLTYLGWADPVFPHLGWDKIHLPTNARERKQIKVQVSKLRQRVRTLQIKTRKLLRKLRGL